MEVVPGVCEAGVAVVVVATRYWMSKQNQGYREKKVAGGASNRAKENGTKVKKKDNARRVVS